MCEHLVPTWWDVRLGAILENLESLVCLDDVDGEGKNLRIIVALIPVSSLLSGPRSYGHWAEL